MWIETNEAEDVAGSIRHALRARQWIAEDPLAWKWVALALHSALQGACVCHLTTSAAPVGAVTERNAGEWLEFFEQQREDSGAKAPKTYLMSLPDMLKQVRKPRSAGDRSNELGIAISDAEIAWLRRFHNDVRNQFVHFAPTAWSLDVSGIPQLTSLIARIISDMLEQAYAFRHLNKPDQDALRHDLKIMAADPLRTP